MVSSAEVVAGIGPVVVSMLRRVCVCVCVRVDRCLSFACRRADRQ